MRAYLHLVQQILADGVRQPNRTGIDAISLPGAMVKYDLREGFPAATTRRAPFKTAISEMCGFLRGFTSAAQFRALNCKVWDANANQNAAWLANPFRGEADDLGPVYGAQWRRWRAYKELPVVPAGRPALHEHVVQLGYEQVAAGDGMLLYRKSIDQVRQCLDMLRENPSDRRILFHGWNPATLDEIALPTCVTVYHFHVNTVRHELSLSCWIRSSDVALGLVANTMQQAFLLELFARLTGYTPRYVTQFISDAHIYVNALEMVEEQLRREPHPLPRLVFSDEVPSLGRDGVYAPDWLDRIGPEHVRLDGYLSHPPLTAPMAV